MFQDRLRSATRVPLTLPPYSLGNIRDVSKRLLDFHKILFS